MVDRWKKLADIQRQHILEATHILGATVKRGVRAFTHAVGIGIEDELPLEERPDDVHQGVMRHPIAEGRGRDQPALRLVDGEAGIGAGPVAAVAQLGLQRQHVGFQVIFERGHGRPAALAAPGLAERQQQVGEGRHFRPQMVITFAHGLCYVPGTCEVPGTC